MLRLHHLTQPNTAFMLTLGQQNEYSNMKRNTHQHKQFLWLLHVTHSTSHLLLLMCETNKWQWIYRYHLYVRGMHVLWHSHRNFVHYFHSSWIQRKDNLIGIPNDDYIIITAMVVEPTVLTLSLYEQKIHKSYLVHCNVRFTWVVI